MHPDQETASVKKTILNYSIKNQGITKQVTVDELLHVHYILFADDHNELKKFLSKLKKDDIDKKLSHKDKFGNTPLHIAAMMGQLDAVKVLIDAGSRVKIRNEQFWTPLHEAISIGNRELVKCLYKKYIGEVKDEFEGSIPKIKASLKDMLDFYVEIKWDFESWIPFVSRFLPSDICKVYKQGTKIRIDTTLEDVARAAHNSDGNDQKFSPLNWKRGDLSFIIDVQQVKNKSSIVFLDNTKKTFIRIDPRQADSVELEGEGFEKEIDYLLSSEIVNVKLDTSQAEFAISEVGWFNKKIKTENLNGYLSNYYDIKNLYIVSRIRVEHLSEEILKKKEMEQKKFLEYFSGKTEQTNFLELSDESQNASNHVNKPHIEGNQPQLIKWEEYLDHSVEQFPVFGRKLKLKENRKEFKAQIAMSEDFPLKITELNSLLEALAPLGKFRRLKEFVDLKLPPGFPVKIEIPIIATISAKVCFQNFKRDFQFDESLFKIPHTYEEINLEKSE